MQGSQIISQVVFHRSSSAEDDKKKISTKKSIFFILRCSNYFFLITEDEVQMNEDKKIEDSQKMCLEWIQKFLCIILKNIEKLKSVF